MRVDTVHRGDLDGVKRVYHINHRVAQLLEKLHIEFTQSRPRHSNDNAPAESKNETILRKHLGYEHIPGHWAPQLNVFHHNHFNPYLNFHRPCFFPVPKEDKKGKIVSPDLPLQVCPLPLDFRAI